MGTATMATQHLLHNLIFRPLRLTAVVPTAALSFLRHHHPKPSISLHRLTRHITTTPRLRCTLLETNTTNSHNFDEIKGEETEITEETEDVVEEEKEEDKVELPLVKREVPVLSVKEKKELGSYAHSLGDKLKSQQIGKSGVTYNVAFALDETLEKRELLKLKIHRNCPGELEDVVRQLEEATGSVVVGQIGRTVILYRPSVTKLKAEEKKEANRRIFAQRRKTFQTPSKMEKRRVTLRQPRQEYHGSRRREKVLS